MNSPYCGLMKRHESHSPAEMSCPWRNARKHSATAQARSSCGCPLSNVPTTGEDVRISKPTIGCVGAGKNRVMRQARYTAASTFTHSQSKNPTGGEGRVNGVNNHAKMGG